MLHSGAPADGHQVKDAVEYCAGANDGQDGQDLLYEDRNVDQGGVAVPRARVVLQGLLVLPESCSHRKDGEPFLHVVLRPRPETIREHAPDCRDGCEDKAQQEHDDFQSAQQVAPVDVNMLVFKGERSLSGIHMTIRIH